MVLPPRVPVRRTIDHLAYLYVVVVPQNARSCRVVGGWLEIGSSLRHGCYRASRIGQTPDMQGHGDTQALKPQPSPQPTAGPGMMSGQRPGGTPRASPTSSAVALRSATPSDAEFCYQLHKAAMGEYIMAIWG